MARVQTADSKLGTARIQVASHVLVCQPLCVGGPCLLGAVPPVPEGEVRLVVLGSHFVAVKIGWDSSH